MAPKKSTRRTPKTRSHRAATKATPPVNEQAPQRPRPKVRVDRQPLTRGGLGLSTDWPGGPKLPPPPWGEALHAAVLRGLMDFPEFESMVLQHYRLSYEVDHTERAIGISLLQLARPNPAMQRLNDPQITKLTNILEEYVGRERWYFLFVRILKAIGWNRELVPSDIDRREMQSRLEQAQKTVIVPIPMAPEPEAAPPRDTERRYDVCVRDQEDRAAAADLRALHHLGPRGPGHPAALFEDGQPADAPTYTPPEPGRAQEQLRVQRQERKPPINRPLGG